MEIVLWTVVGFCLGAIPFSVWLGRLVLGADIRRYGDGNPGAANAWRAGKWRVGVPAVVLDYLKGAVPVGVAHFAAGILGWGLVPVALAPVFGHAFSPFLGFRGGKGLAVTFGIWTGLTFLEGPLVLGFLFTVFILVVHAGDAWSVVLGMVCFLVYLVLRGQAPWILAVWAGNMLILTWKHWRELRQTPPPLPWSRDSRRRTG